jgi:hypothetical protein
MGAKPVESQSQTVETNKLKARLASLDALLSPDGIVSRWLDPIPNKRQFARWLDNAGVPNLKANPLAKRGGGTPYYHVAGVERLLRMRSGISNDERAQ